MNINLIITLDNHLDLGNNFTYMHFCEAIDHKELVELYGKVCSDDDEITIKGRGNCGEVFLHTCGSDLIDHIQGLYEAMFGTL